MFLLSHFRQHFLYRIFCTVQAFCVHFAQMFCVHFARTFFIVYRKKACFNKHAFVFCCAYPSALLVPHFLHRTGVLRTFCPNVLRVFRLNIFLLFIEKACFNKHAFCFYYRISVSTCTVFFAPYRRFAYILPKFTLFSREKSVSVYDTLYLLFLPSAQTLHCFTLRWKSVILEGIFCKIFPLFVQCQIIMVREMRFFCKSTPSTFTSTTSPTFTTSNGCLTNFLAES